MHRGIFSAQTRTEKNSCGWRMMTDVPRKMTVTTCDISSAPLNSDSLGRRISGKALRHRGWIYSQTRPTGPERPTPLHLEPTKTVTHLAHARSRSVRIGVVRFEKNLVAILSAKRQLSVAKLSAKRIFSLAKRDFLVANGRMAADFSNPVIDTRGT